MTRWHVFPCMPGDKRPAVNKWEQRASTDYRDWPSPRHNTGIACGPSHLVVLDLDTHGTGAPDVRSGRDALIKLCEQAGQPWPATHTVRTPSGGWHLYFQAPDGVEIRNSVARIGPMIDVRACGGYVLSAGSVIGGRAYTTLDDCPAAPLPSWIVRLITRCPAAPRRDTRPRLVAALTG